MKKAIFLLLFLSAPMIWAEDGGIRVVSWPLPAASVATASVTTVTISKASAVTLLLSRAARIKAILFNESNTIFIKAGLGASDSDYTWRLPANTELDITDYTGPVTASLSTGSSSACHVTDF